MEFTLIRCWTCPATFMTFSEMATHHLDTHEQPLPSRLLPARVERADGMTLDGLLEERIWSPLLSGDNK